MQYNAYSGTTKNYLGEARPNQHEAITQYERLKAKERLMVVRNGKVMFTIYKTDLYKTSNPDERYFIFFGRAGHPVLLVSKGMKKSNFFKIPTWVKNPSFHPSKKEPEWIMTSTLKDRQAKKNARYFGLVQPRQMGNVPFVQFGRFGKSELLGAMLTGPRP